MAKKEFQSVVGNNLRGKSPQEAAVTMYAGANADKMRNLKAGQRERIELIDIFEIYPDFTQPRRALPSFVRQEWDGNPAHIPALFETWLGWLTTEDRTLIAAVLDGEEVERPEKQPVEVSALIDIAALAGSIRQDGLMNPVNLIKIDERYQIESGERRWLAFHLLYLHTGDDHWRSVPARLVQEFSRWRQAHENNTRADLNAIGRARQFAVLLMDLIGWERFAPFDRFEVEQEFYAQVAEGEDYRVPRGMGERLVNALGLKGGGQLRHYRALLRLPGEIWMQADDENWTEDRIRKLMQSDTVTGVTVSDGETDEDTVTPVTVSDEQAAANSITTTTVTPKNPAKKPTPATVDGGNGIVVPNKPVFVKFSRQVDYEQQQATRMDLEERNLLALMHEEQAKQLRSIK